MVTVGVLCLRRGVVFVLFSEIVRRDLSMFCLRMELLLFIGSRCIIRLRLEPMQENLIVSYFCVYCLYLVLYWN